MRYASKQALVNDIRTAHDFLCARLAEIPAARWDEPGVWGDGWTLSDLISHLAAWQQMFLRWYEEGLRGVEPRMPAPGFRWNETPRLNRAIREQHRLASRPSAQAHFESGYRRIVQIVEGLSPRQLLRPGHFKWTGPHPLATYLGPNTASHYRFAARMIHRWSTSAAARKGVLGARRRG
jgi:hypothetical protein